MKAFTIIAIYRILDIKIDEYDSHLFDLSTKSLILLIVGADDEKEKYSSFPIS
jgi:hypothetical protein